MDRALYGAHGFYVAGAGAGGHFRTSSSASSSVREIFAGAIGELLDRVDAALGHPDALSLVDVGAGSGELLEAILAAIGSDLAARVRPVGVELRPRPAALSSHVHWLDGVPEITGLLIANEWLDNIAIDIVVEGARLGDGLGGGNRAIVGDGAVVGDGAAFGDSVLLVDVRGAESAGPPPTAEEAAWLARWWPTGVRREIGLHRDIAWAAAVSRVSRGLVLAIDYTHTADDRPAYGTLTGFRRGRETNPIPDGIGDLTAHVAIDSVAAAGEESVAAAGEESVAAAGASSGTGTERVVRSLLTDQRTALRWLGVSGRCPNYAADPASYPAALQRASDSAELIDPAGLGAFTWLLQGIDLDPAALLR